MAGGLFTKHVLDYSSKILGHPTSLSVTFQLDEDIDEASTIPVFVLELPGFTGTSFAYSEYRDRTNAWNITWNDSTTTLSLTSQHSIIKDKDYTISVVSNLSLPITPLDEDEATFVLYADWIGKGVDDVTPGSPAVTEALYTDSQLSWAADAMVEEAANITIDLTLSATITEGELIHVRLPGFTDTGSTTDTDIGSFTVGWDADTTTLTLTRRTGTGALVAHTPISVNVNSTFGLIFPDKWISTAYNTLQVSADASATSGITIPWQNLDTISSLSCAVGSYHDLTSVDQPRCVGCAAGTYSDSQLNDPNMLTCQADAGILTCEECTYGTFTNITGMTDCYQCEYGTYASNLGTSECSDCTLGKYSGKMGHVECAECPVGKYAGVEGLTACLDCAQHDYQDKIGQPSCIECPLGMMTYGEGSSECVYCKLGEFREDPLNKTCGACTAGYFCVHGARHMCLPGQYSPPGSHTCSTCTVGRYSAAGSGNCSDCPAGSSCLNPALPPQICQTGYISIGGNVSFCTACSVNETSNSDHTACVACPAGLDCTDPVHPEPCVSGTFNDGNGSCQPCPAGYACPSPYTLQSNCPSGEYSVEGQAACMKCPAGYQCNDPADPVLCASGEYSGEGSISCTACLPGHECKRPVEDPIECRPGYYSVGSQVECSVCTAGHSCADNTAVPVPCAPGQYSLGGVTECSFCPVGFACNVSNTAPIECQLGTYSIGGLQACVDCPAGSACTSPAEEPVACAPGYFAEANAITCTPCPPGEFCSNVTRYDGQPCPAGTYSTGAAVNCTVCPAGRICPFTDKPIELACSKGYYTNTEGQVSCTPCPPGHTCTFLNATYHTSNTTICNTTLVGAGMVNGTNVIINGTTVMVNGTMVDGTNVTECYENITTTFIPSAAYDSSLDTELVFPQACPEGSWSRGMQTECFNCPAGYACTNPNTSDHIACSSGSYSLEGESNCTVCPANSYCPTTTNLPLACPDSVSLVAKYYSHAGSTSCSIVPPGFTLINNSLSACSEGEIGIGGDCYPCVDGFRCPSPDTTLTCEEGTFLDYDTPRVCEFCEAGKKCKQGKPPKWCYFGEYSSSFPFSECQSCNAGYFCENGDTDTGTPGDDAMCAPGHYCPERSLIATAKKCPAGTYMDESGARRELDCKICPAGALCPTAGSISSLPCDLGHYCPMGSSEAIPCPPGTYGDRISLTAVEDCAVCPGGSYCPDNTADTNPIECPIGYFCLQGAHSFDANPCPAGTYSDTTGNRHDSNCTVCPPGHYCPIISIAPTPCPVGTYNPDQRGSLLRSCQPCPAGFSCPEEGMSVADDCDPGHYCPKGSSYGNANQCPPGTYSDVNTTSLSACQTCPAGSACGWKTTHVAGSNGPVACAPGHYCPPGTEKRDQYSCPPGYYLSGTSGAALSDCTICPGGSYCEGGQGSIDGACAEGHYCPAGTNDSYRYPCLAGTYTSSTSLSAINECTDCDAGHYCPEGSVQPIDCSPGTYASTTGYENDGYSEKFQTISTFPSCETCPEGKECDGPGVINPSSCLSGEYSAAGAASCTACKAGYYCDVADIGESVMLANKTCDAGLFCPAGTAVIPSSGTHACALGKYCTAVTPEEIDCPPGTYGPVAGLTSVDDCTACDGGSFCVGGDSSVTGICASGYYCPTGSSTSTQEPCPSGTYRSSEGAASIDDCDICPAGTYCVTGSNVTTACPRGYFCPKGTSMPSPCPAGTYGAAGNLTGVNDCTSCDPGSYCDGPGLIEPTADCASGYYCGSGSSSATPLNGPTYGTCIPGGYCPEGSSASVPCPPGTYQNVSGARSIEFCVSCPPGHYCASDASPAPTGLCEAGFYCTGGANNSRQFTTPAGHFSLEGASTPVPCDAAQYAPETNMTTCLECEAGYYCPNQGTVNYVDCAQGTYCPASSYVPKPCPRSTYGASANLKDVSECTDCDPGTYCDDVGLAAPSGNCTAGHFCTGGSDIATPTESPAMGGYCVEGEYCPIGGAAAIKCPIGTYNPNRFSQSIEACLACPPGRHCNTTGLSENTGPCEEGYFCIHGAESATPALTGTALANYSGPCPLGHYCLAETGHPLPCEEGTYTNNTHTLVCRDCPSSYYCPKAAVDPIICPVGRYCGDKTGTEPPLCEMGTFSNSTGQSICHACTPGMYCEEHGLMAPTDDCESRYSCVSAALDQKGRIDRLSTEDSLCPSGHYCPEGTGLPIPCPIGTYLPSTGNAELADCLSCLPGSYCDSKGLDAVAGPCHEGYYCSGGTITNKPRALNGTSSTSGDICPLGAYCPEGSFAPVLCAAGTYTDTVGQVECHACPAGSFCLKGTSNYSAFVCPVGHYCLNSTRYATEFPCPAGTFRNESAGFDLDSCRSCLPGMYCKEPGLAWPSGDCDGGYACMAASTTPTPEDDATGYRCERGFYCPEGSPAQVSCPAGSYCSTPQLSVNSGRCPQGFYCPPGTIEPHTNRCPRGHYCREGTADPSACPKGTYSPILGSWNITTCIACGAGYYCNETAIHTLTALCTAGFYCPAGVTVPTLPCTAGHYCPTGSHEPVACPAGSYQNETGQAECKVCPAGYYCEGLANTHYAACPKGHYCPGNTSSRFEHPCPQRTYSNLTHLEKESDCLACIPGQYCQGDGLIQPTGLCAAGYYCGGGAEVATPYNDVPTYDNDICITGHYCPAGSPEPVPCVKGTYTGDRGNVEDSGCLPCPAGLYCEAEGSSTLTSKECNAGYVCLHGAYTGAPTDGVTGRACLEGTYCINGSAIETHCEEGTYNPIQGQSVCLECEAGYMCDVEGMSTMNDCPVGFYCPAGTTIPKPCPLGRYSNRTNLRAFTDCDLCPAGMYCDELNLTAPVGECDKGYFCQEGSYRAAPLTLDSQGNGPCPTGHWCGVGVTTPTPCGKGYYNPSNGSNAIEDCVLCTAGFYCDKTGLSAPAGLCSAGSYCPIGANTRNMHTCTPGNHCPIGSIAPIPCPDTQYQPSTGQAVCLSCTAGNYCVNAAADPSPCPLNYYCPPATGNPLVCPDGFYGVKTSISSTDECAACPAGKYCLHGEVYGNCSAGFICYMGMYSTTPAEINSTRQLGGACPPNHFCLEGVIEPQICPNETYHPNFGAAVHSACIPIPAEPGHYRVLDTHIKYKCPPTTYNPITGATNISACLPCPAGYLCSDEGISNFTLYPCPEMHYCEVASNAALPCPAGTYNYVTHGTSPESCVPCPAGHYCPHHSKVTIPCEGGTYCPEGSSEPLNCTAGFYCPALSAGMISCPAGFYCGQNVDIFSPCNVGYYCPLESPIPYLCPPGYFGKHIRTSVEEGCGACQPGKYQTDSVGRLCATCDAGYVCQEACSSATPTNASLNGYICPAGHYCPAGTIVEQPCPEGTYNEFEGQINVDACLPCPLGTFAKRQGQAGCNPCSTSSTTIEVGAEQCTCIGANRAFQSSDQTCICIDGHVAYEGITALPADEDGSFDCQPIVFERCLLGQVRDANGRCVDETNGNCDIMCENGGTYYESFGLCECSDVETLEVVCDKDCRKESPAMTYNTPTTDEGVGSIVITDPDSNVTSSVNTSSIPGYIDSTACPAGKHCKMLSVIASGSGLSGSYDLPPALVNSLASSGDSGARFFVEKTMDRKRAARARVSEYKEKLGQASSSASSPSLFSFGGGRKDVQNNANAFSDRSIESQATSSTKDDTNINPSIVCLSPFDGIFFDVSSGSYPQYVKDSLLNTNSAFDYGTFRELATTAANSTSMQVFSFTFTDSGIYVFQDSADPDTFTIIRVIKASEACPGEGAILPFSFDNLVEVGAVTDSTVTLTPDWFLIGFMGALIGVMIISFGLFFNQFNKTTWTARPPLPAAYKLEALNPKLDLWQFTKKLLEVDERESEADRLAHGVEIKQKQGMTDGAGSTGGQLLQQDNRGDEFDKAGTGEVGVDLDGNMIKQGDLDAFDLESYDFSILYSLLADTKNETLEYFMEYNEEVQYFCDQMAIETEHIKTVLALKTFTQLNASQQSYDEALNAIVYSELLARSIFLDMFQQHEDLITSMMKELDKSIRLISDADYDVSRVKDLVSQLTHQIYQLKSNITSERRRKQTFAAHMEVVGRDITRTLFDNDLKEAMSQDEYMSVVKYFVDQADVILGSVHALESQHMNSIDRLTSSHVAPKEILAEAQRFQMQLMREMKEIILQLAYAEKRLIPICKDLRRYQSKTGKLWKMIQGPMVETRLAELTVKKNDPLFSGLHPFLAKVLSGVMSMKEGIVINDNTCLISAKKTRDKSEPFPRIMNSKEIRLAARKQKKLMILKNAHEDDLDGSDVESDVEEEEEEEKPEEGQSWFKIGLRNAEARANKADDIEFDPEPLLLQELMEEMGKVVTDPQLKGLLTEKIIGLADNLRVKALLAIYRNRLSEKELTLLLTRLVAREKCRSKREKHVRAMMKKVSKDQRASMWDELVHEKCSLHLQQRCCDELKNLCTSMTEDDTAVLTMLEEMKKVKRKESRDIFVECLERLTQERSEMLLTRLFAIKATDDRNTNECERVIKRVVEQDKALDSLTKQDVINYIEDEDNINVRIFNYNHAKYGKQFQAHVKLDAQHAKVLPPEVDISDLLRMRDLSLVELQAKVSLLEQDDNLSGPAYRTKIYSLLKEYKNTLSHFEKSVNELLNIYENDRLDQELLDNADSPKVKAVKNELKQHLLDYDAMLSDDKAVLDKLLHRLDEHQRADDAALDEGGIAALVRRDKEMQTNKTDDDIHARLYALPEAVLEPLPPQIQRISDEETKVSQARELRRLARIQVKNDMVAAMKAEQEKRIRKVGKKQAELEARLAKLYEEQDRMKNIIARVAMAASESLFKKGEDKPTPTDEQFDEHKAKLEDIKQRLQKERLQSDVQLMVNGVFSEARLELIAEKEDVELSHQVDMISSLNEKLALLASAQNANASMSAAQRKSRNDKEISEMKQDLAQALQRLKEMKLKLRSESTSKKKELNQKLANRRQQLMTAIQRKKDSALKAERMRVQKLDLPSLPDEERTKKQAEHKKRVARIEGGVRKIKLQKEVSVLVLGAVAEGRVDLTTERSASTVVRDQEKKVERMQRKLVEALESAADGVVVVSKDDKKEAVKKELKEMIDKAKEQYEETKSKKEQDRVQKKDKLKARIELQKKLNSVQNERKASQAVREEKNRLDREVGGPKLDKEAQAIQAALAQVPEADRRHALKPLIEMVLRPRHQKEKNAQLNQQYIQRDTHFQNLIKAASSKAGSSPAGAKDGEGGRDGDKDGMDMKAMEDSVAKMWDAVHADEAAVLKQRQDQEVKDIFLTVYPEETFQGDEWKSEHDALASFNRRRRAADAEYVRKQQQEEAEDWKRQQEEQKRRHEERLKEEEEAFNKAVEEADRKAQERIEKRRELEEQKKLKELEDMKGLSEEQRDEVLRQHRDNLKRYEDALNAERTRQREAFVAKLAARRKERAAFLERKRVEEERKMKARRARRLEKLAKQKTKQRRKRLMEHRRKMLAERTRIEREKREEEEREAKEEKRKEEKVRKDREKAVLAAFALGMQKKMKKKVKTAAEIKKEIEDDKRTKAAMKNRVPRDKFGRIVRSRKTNYYSLEPDSDEETNELDSAQQKRRVMRKLRNIQGLIHNMDEGAKRFEEDAYVDEKDLTNPAFQPVDVEGMGERLNEKYNTQNDNNTYTAEKCIKKHLMQSWEMSARVLVLYRFANMLIETLTEAGLVKCPVFEGKGAVLLSGQLPRVRLLIAHELPTNHNTSIAFCNSFRYEGRINTLIIRKQRLQDVGEFVLVLIHALAHISTSAASHEWDDRHPDFLKCFYKCLTVSTRELFLSRSDKALSLLGIREGLRAGESAADGEKNALVSTVGMADLIDLHASTSGSTNGTGKDRSIGIRSAEGVASGEFYHPSNVNKRMAYYKTFHQSTKLRQHLLEVERSASRRLHDRMKESFATSHRSGHSLPLLSRTHSAFARKAHAAAAVAAAKGGASETEGRQGQQTGEGKMAEPRKSRINAANLLAKLKAMTSKDPKINSWKHLSSMPSVLNKKKKKDIRSYMNQHLGQHKKSNTRATELSDQMTSKLIQVVDQIAALSQDMQSLQAESMFLNEATIANKRSIYRALCEQKDTIVRQLRGLEQRC